MPLERKTDSYLKDIIAECWTELGYDLWGQRETECFLPK